jgi:hypothetical protein
MAKRGRPRKGGNTNKIFSIPLCQEIEEFIELSHSLNQTPSVILCKLIARYVREQQPLKDMIARAREGIAV